MADDALALCIARPLAAMVHAGVILGVRPANESRCYIVTTSLIGWAHT